MGVNKARNGGMRRKANGISILIITQKWND